LLYIKRTTLIILTLFFAVALVACGSSPYGTGSSAGGSTPTTAPTTAPTPTPTTAPTPTPTASSSALLQTATATVQGKSETILTDAQGKTLYYFTPDTPTTSACTGGCAQTWPPLLAGGSGAPTSSTTLPGKLTVVTTANGSQVAYNGHLLYTYAGDSGPGQTDGEGLFGKWFIATPDLK